MNTPDNKALAELISALNKVQQRPDGMNFRAFEEMLRAHFTREPSTPSAQSSDGVLCIKCGQPTMHLGNVCYACSHPTPSAQSKRTAGRLVNRLELAAARVANARRYRNTDDLAGWEAEAIREAAKFMRDFLAAYEQHEDGEWSSEWQAMASRARALAAPSAQAEEVVGWAKRDADGRLIFDQAEVAPVAADYFALADGEDFIPLYTTPQPQGDATPSAQASGGGEAAGLEAAARFVEQRRDAYDEECGITCPETGAREYPGDGDEYVAELDEIAEGIRALAALSAPQARPNGEARLAVEEDAHMQTIRERDEAEGALGRMFQAVTGRQAEWSSAWHYDDAIEEVEEHVAGLQQARPDGGAVLTIGECVELIWHQGGPCQLAPDTKLYTHPTTAPNTCPEAAEVCAEAYQVVGIMLDDLGAFDSERGEKLLDNLSQHRMVHKDVLPWPSLRNPTPAPDAVARLVEAATTIEETARMVQAGEADRHSLDVDRRRLREALAALTAAQQEGES